MFIYRRVDVAKNYNVVKTMPCLPPMTGNGKRSTYKIVIWGMVYYCFNNIIMFIHVPSNDSKSVSLGK